MSSRFLVGAGISNIALARKMAEAGNSVVVIDQRAELGGNCYDFWDQNGIDIHKYGTHIFHTENEEVWKFLSQFTQWYPYQHEVKALIDKDLQFLAEYVYEKVFLHYTVKQWGVKPEDLDPLVTGRVPVFVGRDNRYFQAKYQGIPLHGYTAMFEKMLDHPNIEVRLNTPFDKSMLKDFDHCFFTGAIDEFFDYQYGELPYRSLKFDFLTFDRPYFQSNSVVNYPCNYDFTRIGEYKYFLGTQSNSTVVSYEYPEPFVLGKNERYYPIINEENKALYAKYLALADKLENVTFLGRLGDYKYYDMDQAVGRVLKLAENFTA